MFEWHLKNTEKYFELKAWKSGKMYASVRRPLGVILKNVSAFMLEICIWQRVGQTNTWHCEIV